jgi:hypothetical protein
MIGMLGEAEHRLQLGFTAAFETSAVSRAKLHDLFDDVSLLIDFDRIHGGIAARVAEFLSRVHESLRQRVEP